MSKAHRRQRDEYPASTKTTAALMPVSFEDVQAVKDQMVPLHQNRSDMVDVRNCTLGMRECHVVAALLGLGPEECLAREQKQQQSATEAATTAAVVVIAPFFQRVHTMRLQLGASLRNGLSAVLLGVRLHTPFLRQLDLSRNRIEPADCAAFAIVIEACKSLTILNFSHNKDLKSAGAVQICTAAAKLPVLRALLLQRCSIHDGGALEIAVLLKAGFKKHMRVAASATAAAAAATAAASEIEGNNNIAQPLNPSVLLTIDLSHNRIGAQGIVALRDATPDWMGIGLERQSPPVPKPQPAK